MKLQRKKLEIKLKLLIEKKITNAEKKIKKKVLECYRNAV